MRQQFTVERTEDRVSMKLTAMLVGRHGKLGVEKTITENVSSRGARVISTSEWYTDDLILVSLPAGRYTTAARVAYCDSLGEGRYAMGLEFAGQNGLLEMSTLAMEPEVAPA